MSQTLYLVRHCQATGQEPDAPLTELGRQQAIALADWFNDVQIGQIISSPFARAYQSIVPLTERRGLIIETDDRLIERVLSPVPLDNWRERLAETFVDLDLSFEGGESSRAAMTRGIAVSTIRRILKSHQLKPWQHHLWLSPKVPRDRAFAKSIREISRLYTAKAA